MDKFFITLLFFIISCNPTYNINVFPKPSHPSPNTSYIYDINSNGFITVNNTPTSLKGLNWFGLENQDLKLHGLWIGEPISFFLDKIKSLGFNALRIPVVKETLDSKSKGSDGYNTPQDELEDLLNLSAQRDIFVVLDLHKCSKDDKMFDKPAPGKGPCEKTLPVNLWIEQLKKLAVISLEHKNVIAIDLFNEPWGLTWNEWKNLSEQAAKAILEINPNVLLFVEGVSDLGAAPDNIPSFWGENLHQALTDLPNIPHNRLVFSPHIYGPSVSNQPYFEAQEFPSNMAAIWDYHWGYLLNTQYAVTIGEWGGKYVDKDKIWGDTFVDYLVNKNVKSFFYWSLNPNSGDTGGLLEDDWRTVNPSKLALIKSLEF